MTINTKTYAKKDIANSQLELLKLLNEYEKIREADIKQHYLSINPILYLIRY